MLQLGVDRVWLSHETDYTRGSLAAILAPSGNPKAKTDKALRRIWEALDREEERQRATIANIGVIKPLGHRVYMEPSEKQFDRWMQVVYCKPGRNFDTWARQGLDAMADRDMGALATAGPALAPLPEPKPEPTNVTYLPFYGLVAAGTPAGALDELPGYPEPVPGLWPANAFALRVSGRSMEPDYPDGSTIVCRKLRDGEYPSKGMNVIASDSSGAYFKRLAYSKDGPKGDKPRKPVPHLVSINPAFPEVVPVSDCPIFALVVGKAP